MPYFERKPYVEMYRNAEASFVGFPDNVPIAELARAVLASETGRQFPLDGPFRCRDICPLGGTGSVTLVLAAPLHSGPVEMRFEPGDFVSAEGGVLPAHLISVSPTEIRLGEGHATDMTISLRVPVLASPGRYQGQINGFGSERIAVAIIFDVGNCQI